ncbi:MAG: Crp/Fnr family transcriptional regulator [Prolixibacteraceae bacterium]|jgi:CRP-like cAMP-binding protein|nr:Crp/Fnr family transcriptional regulator [Prolixibacteraceae bacterium]
MKTIIASDNNYICDIQAPCFQKLSEEETELVKSSKTQILFRKGDNLTKQGAFSSYALFMIKGLAKQYIEGEGNKNYNLRIIKPGEFIGLSTIFSNKRFNYSSVALIECQVFLVETEAINSICKQNGTFALNIMNRYVEQNANLYEKIQTVLYKQMNGRMAETLLYLDSLKSECNEIFQLLTRKDLADFAATSTESAVKLLKSFEKEDFITLNEKDTQLKNYEALKEISIRG